MPAETAELETILNGLLQANKDAAQRFVQDNEDIDKAYQSGKFRDYINEHGQQAVDSESAGLDGSGESGGPSGTGGTGSATGGAG